MEKLARLKGVNGPDKTVTAGNASGVNDGAAALLLASGAAVRSQGLTPMARIVAMASAGVAPRVMGIGPVPATRKLLQRTGLTLDDLGHHRAERSLRPARASPACASWGSRTMTHG